MHQTVAAAFENPIDARKGLEALGAAGFDAEQIGLMMTETQRKAFLGPVPEDRSIEGIAAGGVLGAVLGGLAAIGSFLVPGIGLLVVSGPFMAALAGMGVGATSGGLFGGLVGLGIPDDSARVLSTEVEQAKTIISVTTTDAGSSKLAEQVLAQFRPSRLLVFGAPTIAEVRAEMADTPPSL